MVVDLPAKTPDLEHSPMSIRGRLSIAVRVGC
jgi:translation initiation factor IF-3